MRGWSGSSGSALALRAGLDAESRAEAGNDGDNERRLQDLVDGEHIRNSPDNEGFRNSPDGERLRGSLDRDIVLRYRVVPISFADGTLVLGLSDPWSSVAVDEIRVRYGYRVVVRKVTHQYVDDQLSRLYGISGRNVTSVVEAISEETTSALGAVADSATEGIEVEADAPPVIRLVNSILSDALAAGASDVHLEPYEGLFRVRYRVDGVLYDVVEPPFSLFRAVVSRIKLIARLNIAEKRLPQDGKVRVRLSGRDIDVRVSTVPVVHGESVALRILDRDRSLSDLESLGMSDELLAKVLEAIELSHGLVLVTGPTGSGKTTTLYASLHRVDRTKKKVITIEDPVEYEIPLVNQIEVKPKIGLTFAQTLRHVVRQDPDVILVGEIRDAETAEMAVHSALTGHLVFATLHTNDACSAITRLIDMGVERFLLASTLRAVLAQRLVRTVCRDCRGAGCGSCRGSGYRGRTGIYEFLKMDRDIEALLMSNASSSAIRDMAVSQGMKTLIEDGMAKVDAGVTTREEVLRATQF